MYTAKMCFLMLTLWVMASLTTQKALTKQTWTKWHIWMLNHLYFAGGDNSSDVIMNGDSEYVNEGIEEDEDEEEEDLDQKYAEETGCEEVVKWLNILGDQIVSYFSKDAVYSFPTSLLT
jgi:hypothetical protein